MNGEDASQKRRTLASIESELLKAEEAFIEADHRLNKAESDRRAALEKINKHQTEIDEAIATLRQGSIAGSKWGFATRKAEDALILQPEEATEDRFESCEAKLASSAADESIASHIENLSTYAQPKDGDSVIKVVVQNRGPGSFTPSK